MKAFVFTDESLRGQAGRFVWLEIDTERAVNAPLRSKFPIHALPTFFVVDPSNETVVLRWVGGASAPQLVTMLDKAGDRVQKDGGVAVAEATPGTADEWLERADAAYGAGQDSIAAAAYKEAPPDHDPFEFGLLPGERDNYVITSGAFKGQRGFFTRDKSGAVVGVDLAGRLFNRTPTSEV